MSTEIRVGDTFTVKITGLDKEVKVDKDIVVAIKFELAVLDGLMKGMVLGCWCNKKSLQRNYDNNIDNKQ